MISTVLHPHPVLAMAGRTRRVHVWQAGESVRDLLLRHGFDATQEIVILLNDRLLTVAEWDSVCPVPDDLINVRAVVSGGGGDGEGGGGSNVGQVIALIVVVIVSIYTGGAAGAAWGAAAEGGASLAASTGISAAVAGQVASAVVMMAGSMVVGAIFKPSGRALSEASAAGGASPNYSLAGGSNSLRPYEPLPVVMGQHRIFPDYGARPFTEFQGADQFLFQLFNFGVSSLVLSDLRIGETALADFEGVTLVWSDAAGRLPSFPGNVDSVAGASLTRGGPWTVRTSSPNTVRLAVDIESQGYYSTGKNYIPVTLTFEAEYAPAGSSGWLPMAQREVVSESTHHWSLRLPDETFVRFGSTLPGDQVEGAAEASGWVDLQGAPILAFWRWTSNEVAETNGFPMPVPVVSYALSATRAVVHATQRAERTMLVCEVPAGQYDVRVRLTSAAISYGEISAGDTRGGWSASFSTLRSYQEDSAVYEGQRRLGLIVKATGQLNGVVQLLSCLAEASCLVWGPGGATWQRTSNPAWWFADFARGRRSASGAPLYGCHLDWSALDEEAIVAWAAFCEAEGLSCNLIVDRQQSAFDVLTTIARCGLASPSWGSGRLGVVWDRRNGSPVAAFGMSNIIKGSFSVQYVTENLAEEIVVSYVDAAAGWAQKQVRKVVPGVVSPQRSTTVELMGCTNEAMAGKYANYLAAGQFYRRRMCAWDTDFEGFVCQRGDVVLLSHDLTQWGYSGRLLAVNGATVTLEREVPRNGAAEWLLLALPDGTLTSYSVLAGAAGSLSAVLTLAVPLVLQAGFAAVDHRWFFSPLATPGKRVKIVSVRPVSASRISIVATDEEPAFYAAWDGAWVDPAQVSLLSPGAPTISGVSFSESVIAVGASYLIELALLVRASGGYRAALLRLAVDGVVVDESRIEGARYARVVPATGVVSVTLVPLDVAGVAGPAFEAVHSIAGFAGWLPMPLAPTIYASADAAGHVARAKVTVSFASGADRPVTGLVFFLSTHTFENMMVIAGGGVGATLDVGAAAVLAEGTATVLAGSSPGRVVTKTLSDPYDTSVNHGGRWWAVLPGGTWRKATGIDATAVLFDPPHDVAPVPGSVLSYAEIAWADEREDAYRLAILQDGASYEVIRWGAVAQSGPGGGFQLTGCVRGAEGTTPISADGKTLHYFPAPGPGTKNLVFPATAFSAVDGVFSAETDIDFVVAAGHFASLSAAVYYQQPNGEFVRSAIVPAVYGGPL